MFEVCGTTGVSVSGKHASHFYANNQRWCCDKSRYATSMRRPAQLRSMFLKSHVSQGWQDIKSREVGNVVRGAVRCSRPVESRVFRCSPRSENQHISQLCHFYTNTSDDIVAGSS